jgi:FKBP-type peptidyl-prolyl cis-trans isomerase
MEDLIIFATPNSDNISPNNGNNKIFAGDGDDIIDLSNSGGNNRVFAGGGNDQLIASFNDYLFGGDGDDQLFTGNGGNILSGGSSNDQFWLVKNAIIPENVTNILDFTSGIDKIIIDNVTGVASLNDLTLETLENGTLIKVGDAKLAVLLGINNDQLQETDFLFNYLSISTSLVNDTGISSRDKITSDPTINVNIKNDNIKALKASLGNGSFDVLPLANQDGNLILSPEKLTEINGENLADGDYNLQLIAVDNSDNNLEINIKFTLDTIAPTLDVTNPNIKLSNFTPDLSIADSPIDPTIINLVSPNAKWGIQNLTGNINDANFSSINYQLNSNTPITITVNEQGEFSQGLELTALENTYPNLTVTATDLAGNTTTDNRNLGVILTTETGLGYLDIQVGTGDSPDPNLTDKDDVTVDYTGTTRNPQTGEIYVFDSSRDRGQPSTFSINRVIQGFKEGLDSMNVGGRRILFIPSNLGYGSSGTDNIPPNATLIFDLELFGLS